MSEQQKVEQVAEPMVKVEQTPAVAPATAIPETTTTAAEEPKSEVSEEPKPKKEKKEGGGIKALVSVVKSLFGGCLKLGKREKPSPSADAMSSNIDDKLATESIKEESTPTTEVPTVAVEEPKKEEAAAPIVAATAPTV